jgi:peptide/nickel transport system ATP-binding protein
MAMTAPILEARGVGVAFDVGGRLFVRPRVLHAVRDVSFTLRRGEALGIVGESGCGKSTLAMALLNLQAPSSGEVLLDGIPLARIKRIELARRIQPVFQDPYSSLNPVRNIGQAILQPLRIHRIGDPAEQRRRLARIMDLVGLPARLSASFPDQLSGGQRQRVAIARALIMQPDILICDEPTSALDVSVQAQILNLLQDLRQELGLTFVFISHNLAVVEYMATRVAVMYLGRVIEEAPTAELFVRPLHPYTASLLDAILTPDPDLGLPEASAPGEYPNPLAIPAGCPFHPRCRQVMPKCLTFRPELRTLGTARVACHLGQVD